MRNKIAIIIAVILLLAGVGVMLFPTISNEINKAKANEEIAEFDKCAEDAVDSFLPPWENDASATPAKNAKEAVEKGYTDKQGYPLAKDGSRTGGGRMVFAADLNKLREDSLAYNHSLINNQGTVDTSDYSSAALDMWKYGLPNYYGYISAPSIGLRLPICLGANESVMSYSAAHLCNTSLPLNEKDTNVALAGHTGAVNQVFFDNIINLEKGSTVSITNYWETINYEVIGSKVVVPTDSNDVYIKDGRQLLTLITCITQNGVTNRYIVICEKK